MKYYEARPGIKSGDLIAQTHRKWRSWYDFKVQMVRIFTRSEYSHVAVAWVVGGRVFVLEAVSSGVRIFPLSQCGDFYHFPIGVWTEDAEEFGLAHVGEKYSQIEAVRAFLGTAADEDESWECAELVIAVLKRCNIDLGTSATPTNVVREALLIAPCVFVEAA